MVQEDKSVSVGQTMKVVNSYKKVAIMMILFMTVICVILSGCSDQFSSAIQEENTIIDETPPSTIPPVVIRPGWSVVTTSFDPRAHAASTVAGGSLYIFGGEYRGFPKSTLYRFTPASGFAELSGNVNLTGSSMVSDGIALYLVGGVDDTGASTSRVYAYTISTDLWSECSTLGTGPSGGRYGATASFYQMGTPGMNYLVLFGGSSGDVAGNKDLLSLSLTATSSSGKYRWNRESTDSPVRSFHGSAVVVDTSGLTTVSKLYSFGGYNQTGAVSGELISFDLTTKVWSSIATGTPSPVARQEIQLVTDTLTGLVYMFGGRNGSVFYNDLWVFNPVTQLWKELTAGPYPLTGYVAGCIGGRLYIFGGYNEASGAVNYYADIIVYDPALDPLR
jgi:N-acetylneuraminic acid mutarotase